MDSTRLLADSAKTQAATLLSSLSAAVQDNKSNDGMFAALLSSVQTTAPSPSPQTIPSSSTTGAVTQTVQTPVYTDTPQKNTSSTSSVSSDAISFKPRHAKAAASTAEQPTPPAQKPADASTAGSAKATAKTGKDQKTSSNDTAQNNNQDNTQSQSDPAVTVPDNSGKTTTASDPATTVSTDGQTANGLASGDPTNNQQLLAALALLTPGFVPPALAANTGGAGTTAATATDTGSAFNALTAAQSSASAATGLQALMQAIKGSDAGKNALTNSSADDGATAGDASAKSTDTAAMLTTAKASKLDSALQDMTPATTADAATNFFDLFKNAFAEPANVAVPVMTAGSANAVAAAADSGDASLDLNLQQGSANSGAAQTNAAVAGEGSSVKASAGSEFASQLAATRNATPASLPPAVEQVVMHLSRNVKAGNDQMSLQLNPAELGKINVKLSFSQDGKVQGTVVADNQATLNVLIKDQASLERALSDAGLSTTPGSLQFSLGGQSNNGFDQTANNKTSLPNADGALSINDVAGVADPAAETYYLTPGGVNLHV